jgi:hypothetical protein
VFADVGIEISNSTAAEFFGKDVRILKEKNNCLKLCQCNARHNSSWGFGEILNLEQCY